MNESHGTVEPSAPGVPGDGVALDLDLWDKDRRLRQLTMSRLQRVRWHDPASVASAHRKAQGRFWGAVMGARVLHNREQSEKAPGLGTLGIYEGVVQVPRIDAVLSRHGTLWQSDPDGLSLTGVELWPAHLQWAADRLIETARHLRAGRSLAAIIEVRNQLERWTLNAADSHGLIPDPQEQREAFITRVWEVAQPDLDIDMGQAWAELSEVLHGRGTNAAVTAWSSASRNVSLKSAPIPNEVIELHNWIGQIAVALFMQVRACVFSLSMQSDDAELARGLLGFIQVLEVPDPADLRQLFLDPVDPFLAFGEWAESASLMAVRYRAEMERAGRSGHTNGLQRAAARAVRERRARTIERFREAWAAEADMLGADFDPRNLISRLFRYQAIADGAEVVAAWASSPQDSALQLAAEGLRTASYFWLEDSNLSLFAMRTVLEQTCVARTWRLKPDKASKMAAAGGKAVTPSRWIQACGLNRAQVLGRALGEFSHVDFNSRWSASRRLLEDIQDEATASKPHTARGHALETVAYLLALEVVDRLELVDEGLAHGFREEVTLSDAKQHADTIESLLNRTHDLKNFDFGLPDLSPENNAGTSE